MALGAPPRVIRCPGCGHSHRLSDGFSGTTTACPSCGRAMNLEALASQPTPLPEVADGEVQDQTADLGRHPRSAPSSLAGTPVPRAETPPTPVPAPGSDVPQRISHTGLLVAGTEPADPLLETVLGKCLLKRRLGEGGMGTVYLGRHLTLDIDVAVKVLPPVLAQRDRAFVERFLREARTAARIHHPNIVQVLDVDFQKGCYFLLMEYVDGETAGERLRRKRMLTEREVVELGLDVAGALEYARRKEIIHRDIKPENILISSEGEVKIADLGLAKRAAGETGSGLTLRDQALGTPFYISPEQATNARGADHRSDLYSLGATLFHLATGRPPFQGTSAFDTMTKHLNEPAPELRAYRAELSLELAGIVRKLMQKDPRDRYPTAGQLYLALRDLHERLVPRSERDAALAGADSGARHPAPGGSSKIQLTGAPLGAPSSPSLRWDGAAGPEPAVAGPVRNAPTPAPPAPTPGGGGLFDRLVLRADIPQGQARTPAPAPPATTALSDSARPGEERPTRAWQLLLLVPFANALAYLWVGTLARKSSWFYWGLGLLLVQAVFLYLWREVGEEKVAPGVLALVYLIGLVYGIAIRREFEVRAVEAARAEEEELRRTIGRE